MSNGAGNFTPERIVELRKNIDLSDIPEVTDFSRGHLRNFDTHKVSFTFSLDDDVYARFAKTGLNLESFVKSSIIAVANAKSS